jgi:tetratricopeptide (TPR) repeat protein
MFHVSRNILSLMLALTATALAQVSPAQIERELKQAAQSKPTDFGAQHRLGEFYLGQNRLAAAVPHLERAHRLDATHYVNAYDLALTYVLTGHIDKARAQIAATLRVRETAELFALRGEVEEKAGDVHAAAAAYYRAAELEPSEKHLLSLGNLLVRSTNYNEAIKFFSYGLEKYPRSAQLKVGLGITQYSQGHYEQAVQTLCAAVDLDPTDARPYLFLGEMYGVAPTMTDEITARMAQFVERHPKNAKAHFYYAQNLRYGRRDGRAIDLARVEQALQKAVALDAKLALAHYELGVLYAEREQTAAAIRALQTAVRLEPNSTKAHYRLAQLYQRNGQAQLAARALEAFKRLKAQQEDTKKD